MSGALGSYRVAVAFDEVQRAVLELLAAEDMDPGAVQDRSIDLIAGRLWGDELILSDRAAGDALKVDPKMVKRVRDLLAELTLVADRMCRSFFERSITEEVPRCDLLLYVETCEWDETNFKFTVMHSEVGVNVVGEIVEQSAAADLHCLPEVPVGVKSMMSRDAVVSKLLQTQSRFAFLVRVGAQFMVFRGNTLNWLQVLDRTTAEVLRRAHAATDGRSPSAEDFQTKVRVAIADKASDNSRVAGAILADRGGRWLGLRVECHVHLCSTVHTKSFTLAEELVSGAINFSLCLGEFAEMRAFRQALRDVIGSRLDILHGSPSPAAQEFRSSCMEAFGGVGTHQRARVVALASLCNGDWRQREKVQHYVGPGVDVTEELRADILTKFCNEVVWAIAGHAFSTYPRSRWFGAETSFAELSLVESIHGLGSAAMAAWLDAKRKRKKKAGGAAASREGGVVGVEEDANGGDGGEHDGAEAAGVAEPSGPNTWAEQKCGKKAQGRNLRGCRRASTCSPLIRCLSTLGAPHRELRSPQWREVGSGAEAHRSEGGQWFLGRTHIPVGTGSHACAGGELQGRRPVAVGPRGRVATFARRHAHCAE